MPECFYGDDCIRSIFYFSGSIRIDPYAFQRVEIGLSRSSWLCSQRQSIAGSFDQHLDEIKEELTTLGLPYETLSIPIKYAEVESQTGPDRTLRLPLIAYSDYKLALLRAGFTTDEQPLSGDEGLVMIGSQRDRSLQAGRVKPVYTLKQGLSIREMGYTQNVPIAEYLLPELDGRDGEISVVL